jgi:hypothetical protein
MGRPRFRIRTALILILLAGLVLGFEAWRRRRVMGVHDDPADEAYVRRYFSAAASRP